MKVKIVEENFDKKEWNEVAPHPLQSWEWGEARAKMELDVVRVGKFQNESLRSTFQFTIHRLPMNFKIGYLPRSKYPSTEVLDFLSDYGRKNNLIFIKIEPYERVKATNYELRTTNLRISPHPLFPEWTIILNLAKPEEELLKNMKPKTRYNIRLAQKKGVVVKEMTGEKGFEIFQKLYFETTARQKYFGHNYEYHKSIFESLKSGISHILVAFYEETPLAAYELFLFNDILYYTYGGSSDEHRNLMASHLLMYEAIRFGKAQGAKKFDMWNSLPPEHEDSHPWAGFTRFKEGFGGEFVHLSPGYDLVINPALYRGYNLTYKAREIFLKLKA